MSTIQLASAKELALLMARQVKRSLGTELETECSDNLERFLTQIESITSDCKFVRTICEIYISSPC
jgi:hypothetical protein